MELASGGKSMKDEFERSETRLKARVSQKNAGKGTCALEGWLCARAPQVSSKLLKIF